MSSRQPLCCPYAANKQTQTHVESGTIYGWTMNPGYFGHPYRSPVLVNSVKPCGQRTFELSFLNIFYAAGAQGMVMTFSMSMFVDHRASTDGLAPAASAFIATTTSLAL